MMIGAQQQGSQMMDPAMMAQQIQMMQQQMQQQQMMSQQQNVMTMPGSMYEHDNDPNMAMANVLKNSVLPEKHYSESDEGNVFWILLFKWFHQKKDFKNHVKTIIHANASPITRAAQRRRNGARRRKIKNTPRPNHPRVVAVSSVIWRR